MQRLRSALIALREFPDETWAIRDVVVASVYSMRQGSGLGWQNVDDLITEVFGERPDPPTLRSE